MPEVSLSRRCSSPGSDGLQARETRNLGEAGEHEGEKGLSLARAQGRRVSPAGLVHDDERFILEQDRRLRRACIYLNRASSFSTAAASSAMTG